jgi:peptidoglycan hydrolase-like protein with peptidoglycan-binding domain
MTKRITRRTTVVGICLVGALAAGLGTWAVLAPPGSAASAASSSDSARSTAKQEHATAPVTKGDLADSKVFAGTLGYGAPTGVPGTASGTLTWLPKPGDVIGRDKPLYAVDERPVRTMFGATPVWRALEFGAKGADVLQLNQNLAALGYDVSVDDVFGKRTLRAVKRYQEDRDLKVTGVLTAQDVVFVDGDVRVASVQGQLGRPTSGEVLGVTSTDRIVSATVPQADADRLAVGTAVEVRVNGAGDPIAGTVQDAAPAEADESGGGSGKVDVTIAFDPGDRELPTAASAQVVANGRTERDVLSVPVSALVAGDGDGFAVDVARRDGTTKRVRVQVGFVAEGRAAVTGGVHEGDEVVVPS